MLDKIVNDMIAEMRRAQAKYPSWPMNIVEAAAVVSEEMGEVVKDANTYRWRQGKATPQDIYTEAIQTGAMLLRFLTETPVMAALTQGHMFADMIKQPPDYLPCISVEGVSPSIPDPTPYAKNGHSILVGKVEHAIDRNRTLKVAQKLCTYGKFTPDVVIVLRDESNLNMKLLQAYTGLSDRTIRDLLTKAGRDMVNAGYAPLVIREKRGREVFYSLAPDWEARLEKSMTHQLEPIPAYRGSTWERVVG